MAKLNEEQERQLAELEKLRDTPDEPQTPSHSRVENLNITVDLGDEAQVKRALALGLLTQADVDDATDDDGKPPPDAKPDRADRY